jgi:hypothetical protein
LVTSASRWLLAGGTLGAALAVGAVHTAIVCVVLVVVAAAALLGCWRGPPPNLRVSAKALLKIGVVLTLYTAVQCIPLPRSVVHLVAPYNADVWARALRPLGEGGPHWITISLAPLATRVELSKGVLYVLAFLATLRIAGHRRGIQFLSWALVATALALACATVLHPAFGAHKVFGVYQPIANIPERHIAPLLNPNHLAGYLNLGICVALAIAATADVHIKRVIPSAIVILLGATQVWVASRAGVICMFVGIISVVMMLRYYAKGLPARSLWGVLGVATLGAVLLVLASNDQAIDELFVTDISKFKVMLDALGLLARCGVLGVGRGAFQESFPHFRGGVGYITVTHPENVAVQWAAEWGIPVAVLGLGGIAFCVRPALALSRAPVVAGAWSGLAAIAVQNMADFSSEIPGVMMGAVVCAGIVTAGTAGRGRPKARGLAKNAYRLSLLGTIGGVAILALAIDLSCLGKELEDDRKTMYAATAGAESPSKARGDARAAMLRHPAEPYMPFAMSVWAARERVENPLPWLEATLERAAVYAPAHLVLARILSRSVPSQSRLEYRLAMEQGPDMVEGVISEAAHLVGTYEDALALVPAGPNGYRVMDRIASSVQDRLPATRVRLDEDLAAHAPEMGEPTSRLAEDVVADIKSGESATWCEFEGRSMCVKKGIALARHLEEKDPNHCNGYSIESRVQWAAGNTREAVSVLERAEDRVVDRKVCLRVEAELAASTGNSELLEHALAGIVDGSCATDRECFDDYVHVGDLQRRRGNAAAGLTAYRRANKIVPGTDWLILRMAEVASEAGLHGEAADDYDALARLHPDQAQWPQASAKEREAFVRNVLR